MAKISGTGCGTLVVLLLSLLCTPAKGEEQGQGAAAQAAPDASAPDVGEESAPRKRSAAETGILRMELPSKPYQRWSAFYKLVGGPDDDSDGDGMTNLYEYGLNGNPTNPNDTGYIQYFAREQDGKTWYEYIYARRITPGCELVYTLQTTTSTSGKWVDNAHSVLPGRGKLNADFEIVTNRVYYSMGQEKYIRLLITTK